MNRFPSNENSLHSKGCRGFFPPIPSKSKAFQRYPKSPGAPSLQDAGCPILAAASSRQGWDTTNLNTGTLYRPSASISSRQQRRVPHPCRSFIAARMEYHPAKFRNVTLHNQPPQVHASSALTLGIHSLIGIFCGQMSSQVPQSTHATDLCASFKNTWYLNFAVPKSSNKCA